MKRLFSSFALAVLVTLGASGIAYADQSVSCANVNTVNLNQFTVIGTATTACSITSTISASASIEILGTTITDTMPISNSAGNILMISQGAITTSGTITGAPNFNVDIKANQGGSGSLTIGSGGVSKIVAMSQSIVYVTNGTASSTGTLTLSATSAISVPDGSNDYIILNAQAGTLSMPTGTLSSTGSSGPAGQIQLLAATVNFANNAILTTAQTSSGYSNHGVAISAKTINYGGTTTGLNVIGDGNGGFAYLLAQGATTIADSGNYKNLTIVVTNTETVQSPLSVVGAAGAPFKMTANNSNTGIYVVGYPISFTGGAVTLQANGPGGQFLEVFNPGTLSGTTGLTFGGTGTVLIDASGSGGNGGYVYINADQAVVSAPTLTINASGPSSGSGNGGTLYFQTTKTTLSGATVSILNNGSATGTGNAGSYTQFYSSGAVQMPTTTFTLSANGSSGGAGNGGPVSFQGSATTVPAGLKSTITANGGGSGTGNGGAITMYPVSNITLGNNAGQFAVAATSGSTGGNGGSISIEPFGSTLTVANTATPISVAVRGATGNGGSITLEASTLTFNGTTSQLTANGGSTSGNGGSITLSASSTALTIGTGSSGNVQLYAKAPGNGNGGSISVTDYTGITVNSADLSVLAGTTGNGNGGTIAFTGGPATLTGSFNANGSGNGTGGTLNFQNGYFTFNGTQSFTANSSGTGQGGTITFNSTYNESSTLTLGVNTTLEANSTSGNAGTITITSAYQPVDIADDITLNAGGNGNGGTLSVTAVQITLTGTLTANGQGTGDGGNITLNSTTTPMDLSSLTATAIFAQGGNNSMTNGGSVVIANVSHLDPEQLQVVVNNEPDGDSFSDDIIALRKAAAIHPNTDPTFTAMGSKQSINILTAGLCKQYMVTGGTNPQPYTFWDCSNGASNSNLPATFVATTTAIPSTILQSIFPSVPAQNAPESSTALYVWVDPAAYDTAYGLTFLDPSYAPSNEGGQTDPVTGTATKYQVNIFEKSEIAGTEVALSQFQIQENTAHELGHVWDNNNGNSYSTAYSSSYISYDQSNLTNDTGAGSADKGAAANVPCTASNGNKAPFDGQTGLAGSVYNDVTNTQVCNESTGVSNVTYSPVTNLTLAQTVSPGILGPTGGPREIFPQAFAWVVFVQPTLTPYVYNTPYQEAIDGLFENGYYACAVDYAKFLINGVAFPTGQCGH